MSLTRATSPLELSHIVALQVITSAVHLKSSIKFLAAICAQKSRTCMAGFLLNLNFMQQCPVQSIVNSMARVERIKDDVCSTPEYRIRGGDFPASTANFFHQLATAVSACQPQRVQTSAQSPVWHSAVQAHGILSPLSVSRKGGERTGEDDLASDTSLVHSQLQVRGGVSPGQYHSTVMAT